MQCFLLPIQVCNDINALLAKFWWGSEESKKNIHWMKWKQLCKPKHEGGLGFGDLRTFNKSLLGKQIWRLIKEPNSALAQTLQAKYYPNGTIWTAQLGSQPSFTWKSIISVRDDFISGIKWEVGDGKSINVWDSRWMTHTWSNKPITPKTEAHKHLKVSELIDEEIGVWNIDKVKSIFFEVDWQEIIRIPLQNLHRGDKFHWANNPKGIYSVKHAYQWFQKTDRNPEEHSETHRSDKLFFSKLWKIRIPGKVIHFLWRAIFNILPTSDNLKKKKILEDDSCGLCRSEQESCLHVFNSCSYTQSVCASIQISNQVTTVHNFRELFEIRWKKLPPDKFRLWCICIWNVWLQRNLKVKEKDTSKPQAVAIFGEQFLQAQDSAPEDLRRLSGKVLSSE